MSQNNINDIKTQTGADTSVVSGEARRNVAHTHDKDGHDKNVDHSKHNHAGHDHGHDHGEAGHSHAPSVSASNERIVLIGFVLTFTYMIAEVIGGVLSGSLALIADAGHMLTDAAALLLAWAAFRVGRRLSDSKRTFGYMRFEVLAGFINAITLFLLTGWIVYEAVNRVMQPTQILAGPMMVVAVIGLFVNILVFYILSRGDKDHVNIKGALLHVMGDLLGSVGAILASVIIYFTGWTVVDPILSVVLSLLILRAAWSLMKSALQILMEGTPPNIELDALKEHILARVKDAQAVEHVHVWSITSGKPAATMEVTPKPNADIKTLAARVKLALEEKYGISHSNIELNFDPRQDDCIFEGQGKSDEHVHAH